ncbi:MAG: hypothetical protein JNK47_13780 [Mesorhizobium sp.]|nr:hypothetical protein [Mesorhizobium sp.]MBL8578290.1 hypothetical protein [Mesorhizobium sp.]
MKERHPQWLFQEFRPQTLNHASRTRRLLSDQRKCWIFLFDGKKLTRKQLHELLSAAGCFEGICNPDMSCFWTIPATPTLRSASWLFLTIEKQAGERR